MTTPATVSTPTADRRPRPGQSPTQPFRPWYEAVRYAAVLTLGLRGGVRVTGRDNLPRQGGALIVSNHISFLDVFVLGVGVPRVLNYVARSSLFVPVLGPLIRSVGGFPIEREGGGVAGLKETLRRLKGGGLVLIFPEGTRSPDGEIGPLKPGIAALARARVPFIPVAVAGAFEAFPKGVTLPRPHPIWVHFGAPIRPDDFATMEPAVLSDLVRSRMIEAQHVARAGLRRSLGPRFGEDSGA